MPSFLTITKESLAFLEENIKLAEKIHESPADFKNLLEKKTVALLFGKPSTRTRIAFELACFELSAHASFLSHSDLHLGKTESIEDTACTLGTLFSALVFRGFSSKVLRTLASYSKIPVINALTDDSHPTQALTDIFTIKEHFNRLEDLNVLFIGDATNNVAHSLTKIALLFGINITLCAPEAYLPTKEHVKKLHEFNVKKSSITLETDPMLASSKADVVYTDVWTSMNQNDEREKREKAFRNYKVTSKLMKNTNKAIFLHCLPAQRGKEVSNEVIDADYSLVWKQARNKKTISKSILITCIR